MKIKIEIKTCKERVNGEYFLSGMVLASDGPIFTFIAITDKWFNIKDEEDLQIIYSHYQYIYPRENEVRELIKSTIRSRRLDFILNDKKWSKF
ncbi:hypothetical protein HPT25_01645 [Bacillus sp. BRMEA1]|uniref:hypothetical protein n=1 Tax=Neobacillus endophyticus TaxID=2738405 RepID=UPI0015660E74|nr:hypothetical protein [Neobacillus endophyticus]NRD76211.1 hypothetical protein [Neobacillus endophyticus]